MEKGDREGEEGRREGYQGEEKTHTQREKQVQTQKHTNKRRTKPIKKGDRSLATCSRF